MIQQNAPGFVTVAACSANLLIIVDRTDGQRVMDNKPDIGDIDPHPESRSSDHDTPFILDKLMIMLQYYREYRVMDNIAFDYGVSKSTISDAIKWVEETLDLFGNQKTQC